MSIFVFIVAHLSLNLSIAQDVSSIACGSLETLTSINSDLRESRSEVQKFLKNSEYYLNQKIELQDLDAIAVACGFIDDVTTGFTKPCLDDTNTVIDIKRAQKLCENYLNK
jgi:hypothetical protein